MSSQERDKTEINGQGPFVRKDAGPQEARALRSALARIGGFGLRRLWAICNWVRKNPKRSLVGLFVLLLCAWALLPDAGKGLEVIRADRVTRGTIRKEQAVTGIIKPEEGAEVKTGTRFTGVVRRLYVKLGDVVEKGQLIAEMDDREQKAECEKIEAAARSLEAGYEQTQAVYPLKIEEAELSIKAKEVEVAYAKASHGRFSKMRRGSTASEEDSDHALKQYAIAVHELDAARAFKKRLSEEYRTELTRSRELIEEARRELASARTRLSYAQIVSPMDGVVSEITTQEGETLVAGLQVAYLVTVLAPSRLELRIYVDENDIGLVKEGVRVSFSVEALRDIIFAGVVDLIHPGPEVRNNIVYYRALVRLEPEAALRLRPEMTARCRILVAEKENVLLIPNTAFKWLGARRVVFVKDASGAVSIVRPEIGIEGLTHSEVLSGLDEGAAVITELTLPSPLPKEWLRE